MRRGCGILLHISSLPSLYGVGDLGPGAYQFADFLTETGQTFWQVLPLNPTNPGAGNSPYNSLSSLAGNPLLISPEKMFQEGWLIEEDIQDVPEFSQDKVDFAAVAQYKEKLFKSAFERFKTEKKYHHFRQFCAENSDWLEDFAAFMAFRKNFNQQGWSTWPPEIRDRKREALEDLRRELHEQIEMEKFLQFIFFSQWRTLKQYCNERGIQIIGDIPYYVSYDSTDVWTYPGLFKLDEEKNPTFVAGVPPDYFSETGQLWGNPVYSWDVLKDSGYVWWVRRMQHLLQRFDMLRIDHFRGFVAYWEVPATETTAMNGNWVEVPTIDFFNTLQKYLPNLPIIAEDLGLITADVREIIQQFGFPGMKVLLFAFDETLPRNPYAPHNHIKNCVVYTGTHDNNTIRGWFEQEISEADRNRVQRYLGGTIPIEELHWEFIRLALMSVANVVIISIQDILGLGEEARMNYPSRTDGNWQWRLVFEQIEPEVKERLREMVWMYGRD